MNISLMLDSWGLKGQEFISLNILHNHRGSLKALIKLHKVLEAEYGMENLPEYIVDMQSEVLGVSILQYLFNTENGAQKILDKLNLTEKG